MKSKKHIWAVGRQAFTLVELLMVIAIIALMAALLMPALKSAREHGRRARCLSNMHQIGIAMSMYADQNDGKLPPYFYTVQKSGSTYQILIKSGWAVWDVGMIANAKILVCPTDTNPVLINTTDTKGNSITVPTSYGYNFELFIQGQGIQAVDASQTVLVFDGEPDQVSGDWAGTGAGVSASLGGSGSGADGGVALAGANGGGTGGGSSGGSSGGGSLTCTADSNNKTWLCHVPPGNPSQAACHYVGFDASGPQGHSNHSSDYCGPCTGKTGCDLVRFNAQLINPRHFNRANFVFLDGHGEWLTALPSL